MNKGKMRRIFGWRIAAVEETRNGMNKTLPNWEGRRGGVRRLFAFVLVVTMSDSGSEWGGSGDEYNGRKQEVCYGGAFFLPGDELRIIIQIFSIAENDEKSRLPKTRHLGTHKLSQPNEQFF